MRDTVTPLDLPIAAGLRDPDALLRQRDAAALLAVSVAWLRASSCPKVLLPGNATRPVVRYKRSAVLRWEAAWAENVNRAASGY